jgi:general secretion pathway protein G
VHPSRILLGSAITLLMMRCAKQGEPEDEAKTRIRMMKLCLDLRQYKIDNGRLPTVEQGLRALVQGPAGESRETGYRIGGYAIEPDLLDQWKKEIRYELEMGPGGDERAVVFSDGRPDGNGGAIRVACEEVRL